MFKINIALNTTYRTLCCKVIDIFSNCKQKTYICTLLAALFSLTATAQTLNARYLDYIERYKAIAMEHSKTLGIPASITLAQGLLESRAGQSYLATRGNNHFGIKCHKWAGEAVEYDDSLKHDCYRKYETAEESFNDHAKFLKGKRYGPLYEHHVSKYRQWAHGLRRCGYAEDPAYPQKLIALIEQYELYKFDNAQRDTTTIETTSTQNQTVEAAPKTADNPTAKPAEPTANAKPPVRHKPERKPEKPVPFPQSKIGKRIEPVEPEKTTPKVADQQAAKQTKELAEPTKATTEPTKAKQEPKAKQEQVKEPVKEQQEPAKASKRQHNQRRSSTTSPLKGSTDN
ncbi:MAG: glucosaminidase domain-containing protein [Bacteroidales bacterium]|nr:glucosaminidase domain-containing protein [Candidatus Sodaliphilus fimicaballi]